MKEAVIYYEGNSVCSVYFDEVISSGDSLKFFLKGEEIALFGKGYSYKIYTEEELKTEERKLANALASIEYGKELKKWWEF